MIRILIVVLAMLMVNTLNAAENKISASFHNTSGFDWSNVVRELPADSVLGEVKSQYCYVTDSDGNEVPSQITYDFKLIFPVSAKAGDSVRYCIHASDTPHVYDAAVSGRKFPERADDVAWENEIVGFRVYGPATQSKGERSYGYDIFLKYPDKGLVLERLYESQTNRANWQKYDSLAKIDRNLAKKFENSISYHIDHGFGMDCYAVGATLGDGVAALLDNDSISFPWCYSSMEILDNGPIRFTVALDFPPRVIGNDTVTEHRLISLDSKSHLNRCVVWYDGLSYGRDIVVGFPLRDESPVYHDCCCGILAYADPTQGPDNGRAMLGVVLDRPASEFMKLQDHALLRYHLDPGEKFSYMWGFAWDRADIPSLDAWRRYLSLWL